MLKKLKLNYVDLWRSTRPSRKMEVLVTQSCSTLCDPKTVAHRAPPSIGFLRQVKHSGVGCHFLLKWIFSTQGNLGLPHHRQILYHLSNQGSPGTRPSRTNIKKDILFIIGDWNTKVVSQGIPGVTGKFGLKVQSEAGQRLTVLPRDTHWS